jgi:hypothetical protein
MSQKGHDPADQGNNSEWPLRLKAEVRPAALPTGAEAKDVDARIKSGQRGL